MKYARAWCVLGGQASHVDGWVDVGIEQHNKPGEKAGTSHVDGWDVGIEQHSKPGEKAGTSHASGPGLACVDTGVRGT